MSEAKNGITKELKKLKEDENRIQAELNKGDEEKVKDLISDFEAPKTKYVFKSKKNQKMYSEVISLIDEIIAHIEKMKDKTKKGNPVLRLTDLVERSDYIVNAFTSWDIVTYNKAADSSFKKWIDNKKLFEIETKC